MAEHPKLMSEEAAKIIVARLKERGIDQSRCPMCQSDQFTLIDGFTAPLLFRNVREASEILNRNKTFFPCVGVVCINCGFLAQHSLGVLDLMELFTKASGEAEGTKKPEGGQSE